MGRAPCCDKANVKKGPWSPEEDAKLREYIEKYGTGGNWIALPQKAGLKRCGKSCRLRWLNYLRPNIRHGEFSDEEDRIICSLYASIGSRWSIIAAQLPGRTDNDIKNYWNTKLKKKLMGSSSSSLSTTPNHNYINHKKPHPYDHQQHRFPMLSSPSLLLSSALSSVSSPSPYQCTSTTYYNSPSSTMNMSFSAGGYYSTFDTMQNYTQQKVKDNSTLLMFGGGAGGDQQQPTSCTSSDGSCSTSQAALIKSEDNIINKMQRNFGLYSNQVHQHEEEQKPSIVNSSNNNSAGLWGQNSQRNNSTYSLVDYGLEEIKQLISTNSNVGNSFNYFDETKVADGENSKLMYYHY